jgi:3-methyladenine DNA glycosylase Tag
MRKFAEIERIAADRKGGPDKLGAVLVQPLDPAALAAVPLPTWLEAMAKAIFQAGFNWRVIDAKWEGFREAFRGFDPGILAFWHDEHIDALLKDTRIVRNGQKISAVLENARFLSALDEETGNASRQLAEWPVEDHAGLLELFATRGSRLGGNTGQRVCRMVGRDSYVLSRDVVKRLVEEGVVDGPPTSKSAMKRVQAAFNAWRGESGRPLAQISQILAMSID